VKFFFCGSGPDQKHRDRTFTRHISAFTLEDPREPGRPAFLQLAIKMDYHNQGLARIQQAIEAITGCPVELAGGYKFQP